MALDNDITRKSPYKMLEVDEAISIILSQCHDIIDNNNNIVYLSLLQANGSIIAQDVYSIEPFPTFRASIMDGYAVKAPLIPGIYQVIDRIHAGKLPLDINQDPHSHTIISYITTGGMIPEYANAVVKIEDTELNKEDQSNLNTSREKSIKINVSTEPGVNIREIGSDIQTNEIILKKGDKITPAEIGLLATIGITQVPCYKKPIIGVMSTGNELVNPSDFPLGSQIRDSNRYTLISSFIEDGYQCLDLGIIADNEDELQEAFIEAVMRCDLVVTSGGVSMGEKDLVKPLLAKLGTIHFGRLNMKPGKPSTFATITINNKKTFFFGLPGNPVSCLVTKCLLIDPMLRRLQGLDSLQCMHSQIIATLENGCKNIVLDPERPEYHRVIVSFDFKLNKLVVRSTGNQRSSRLLSMKDSNALLCLPKGSGVMCAGQEVTVLMTRPLTVPSESSLCFHQSAASLDFPRIQSVNTVKCESINTINASTSQSVDSSIHTSAAVDVKAVVYESFESLLSNNDVKSITESSNEVLVDNMKGKDWRTIRVGVLTISDRAYQGIYKDESGPEISRQLSLMSSDNEWPLIAAIVCTNIVPDEKIMIQKQIMDWTATSGDVDLILTTGGTGFGPRDITPEAVKPLLHREAPGVAQALLNEGLKHTPLAVMSRPVVGTRGECLICTLPGSVKAVKENIVALKPLLFRMMELIKSGKCSHV